MSEFLHDRNSVAELEALREFGDYDKLAIGLPNDWETAPPFLEENVRIRLLIADICRREGRADDMEAALSPYFEGLRHVPFSIAARTQIACSAFQELTGDFRASLRTARIASRIASAQGDIRDASEATETEGRVLCRLEDWRQAIERFEEAVVQYAGQGRFYRLGLAYRLLGEAKMHIGEIESARNDIDRAIRMLAKSRDESGLADARISMAEVLNLSCTYDISRKYLQLASDVYERVGCPSHILRSLIKTAETLILMKDYEKAEPYLARSLEFAAHCNDGEMAILNELQGRLHIARGRWSEAETALTAAISEARRRKERLLEAMARRTLARLYVKQQRDADAIRLLNEARQIAEDTQARILELEVRLLLAEAACGSAPVEACRAVAAVESEIADLPLPDLKAQCQFARDQIKSRVGDQYFMLSDTILPSLHEARSALLRWLWDRSLDRAKGNAADAAELLNVTPTYIRQLTKRNTRNTSRSAKGMAKNPDAAAGKARRASS